MISKFQKLIYKLSCIAPICVILAIILYTQDFNITFCILLGLVGIGGCAYAIIFIKLCEKRLPILKITVDNITPDDTSTFAYFATYLIPLIGIIWKDDLLVWVVIAVVVAVMGIRMSNLSFCPILLLAGYHCYKVNLSTGTECILISRKKGIRSSKQIEQVIRIDDTLILEEMGGKADV